MGEETTKKKEENTILEKDIKIGTIIKRKMSDKIKDTLADLKDLATLELRMPVEARMRERLKTIKKLGSARHLKIEGQWTTYPPKHHITKLIGKKISNDEAQIRFSVYETDDKGNKVLYEHKVKETRSDGVTVERVLSAEYRIAYEIIETIRRNKLITREEVEIDNNR